MSPRMSRFWGYLNAHGVALSDFSTDECVLRELPRLHKARAELNTLLNRTEPDLPSLSDLEALGRDLDNLMRRLPTARVSLANFVKSGPVVAVKKTLQEIAGGDPPVEDSPMAQALAKARAKVKR